MYAVHSYIVMYSYTKCNILRRSRPVKCRKLELRMLGLLVKFITLPYEQFGKLRNLQEEF